MGGLEDAMSWRLNEAVQVVGLRGLCFGEGILQRRGKKRGKWGGKRQSMPARNLGAISGPQRCIQLPGPEGGHLGCVSTQLPAKEGTGRTDRPARSSGAQFHGW